MEDTDDEADEIKQINSSLKITSITNSSNCLSSSVTKSLNKVAEETTSDDAGIVFDFYEEDELSSSDSVSIPSSEGIVANGESPISDIESNRKECVGLENKVNGTRIHPLQLIARVIST